MHTLLARSARYVYLAGIVLAVAFIVPVAWFPFQLTKVTLFAVLAAVAVLLFVAGGGARELLRAHGFKLALLTALLPLVYLLSTQLSINPSVAFLGYGVGADTVLFTVFGFLAFLLAFVLFRTLRPAQLLTKAVAWAAGVALVFQWIVIFFGTTLVPFDAFADSSVNLVGKWNDLGLLTGVLLVFLLVRLELSRLSLAHKGLLGALAVLATLLLAVINFSLVWWLLLVASLTLALVAFMANRKESAMEAASDPYAVMPWANKVPWFAAGGVLLAIAFLIFGSGINIWLTNSLSISSLEVRPSYQSTIDVISAARENPLQTLVGTGPSTFNYLWLGHKATEINQSLFWNLDFNVGFSTILTAFGTTGLLGAAAWLIPLLLVVAGVVRVARLSVLSREERITALMLVLGTVILFAALMFYVPSPSLVLLSFVLAGAAFGFLWRQGRQGGDEAETPPSRLARLGVLAVLLVLIFLPLWSGITVTRYFLAQTYVGAGTYALQSGDTDTALARAAQARGAWETPDSLRLAVDAGAVKINQIASTESAPSAEVQAMFNNTVVSTIEAGKELVAMSPLDYRAHLSIGRVYDMLASLGVEGAYASAKQEYEAAAAQNPTSPAIPLALARLEASQNNLEATQTYLTQALTLKPNYTDAILLVVQLNVANNDLASAIQAAQAAAQTAPGIAPIWFQLGLLHYSGDDHANAIPAFEAAVTLVPEYANAKYFLGLSYYAQNRAEEAIRQFEELLLTNQDNAEVQLILSNMRAGKPAFESAEPPITDTPEERPTAPINE